MIRPGKQSSVICSEQTTKRSVGLKFLRCEDTNLFQLDKTVPLGGELCKEIPSRGFEPLLQSRTTQQRAGILLSRTSSVRISIVFVKKTTAKTFQALTCRKLRKPSCFCCLDWMTSLPSRPNFLSCSRPYLNFVMAGGRSQKLSLN